MGDKKRELKARKKKGGGGGEGKSGEGNEQLLLSHTISMALPPTVIPPTLVFSGLSPDREPEQIEALDKLIKSMAPRLAAVYEKFHGKVKDAQTAKTFLHEMAVAIVQAPTVPANTAAAINEMYRFRQGIQLVPLLGENGAEIEGITEVKPGTFGTFIAVALTDKSNLDNKKMVFSAFFDEGLFLRSGQDKKLISPLHLEKVALHEIIVHGTLHHATCMAIGEKKYAEELQTHKLKRNMRHELLAAMVDFMVVRTIPKEILDAEIAALRPYEGSYRFSEGHIDALARMGAGYRDLTIEQIAAFQHKGYHARDFRDPNPIYYDAISRQLVKPILEAHKRVVGPGGRVD